MNIIIIISLPSSPQHWRAHTTKQKKKKTDKRGKSEKENTHTTNKQLVYIFEYV